MNPSATKVFPLFGSITVFSPTDGHLVIHCKAVVKGPAFTALDDGLCYCISFSLYFCVLCLCLLLFITDDL